MAQYVGGRGRIISETGTRQWVGSDGSAINERSGGGSSANAPGASLTSTTTLTGGTGSGGGSAAAAGASLTATATLSGGVATGGAGAAGTLTTRPQKNNTRTVMANETGAEVFIWDATTGVLVLRKTGVTLNASGVATVTDGAIIPGTSYIYDVKLTGNRRRCNPKAAT